MEIHVAPWSCCMEFNGKISMEFRGLIKFHGVPWNTTAFLMEFEWKDIISMEFIDENISLIMLCH